MSTKKNETRNRILAATWNLLSKSEGGDVSMSDIAKEVGLSRQAVYLHFQSRSELMVATVDHVDEVLGVQERLKQLHEAKDAVQLIEYFLDFWSYYVPEVYGLAKVLLVTRDTDEANACAWDSCMGHLRNISRVIVEKMESEGLLASEWELDDAAQMFWALVSIQNWEQLTVDCGWSSERYVKWMKLTLFRTFLAKH